MRCGSRVVTLLVGFFLVSSILVLAQIATTSLRGTVFDRKAPWSPGRPSLSPIQHRPDSKDEDRRSRQLSVSRVAAGEVRPGRRGSGFCSRLRQSASGASVVSTPATLNVNLQVTGGTVTVEVSGTTPLVNTQDASLGHAFGADQIADLPFEGRDPGGILSLQTGVVFTGNSPHLAALSRQPGRDGERCTQRPDQHHPRWYRQQ